MRIMIVDDHEVVRVGLRAVLELEDDVQVVGDAASAREAIARAPVLRPDVVLMDVVMEPVGGIEACRELKALLPGVRVLMLTSYADQEAVCASILAGAGGYLLKNAARAELLRAIRAVAQGQVLLDPAVARAVTERLVSLASQPRGDLPQPLSEREREVLALVARGHTNKEIADKLVISEKTARNHLSNILAKLGLSRRSEAAAYAVRKKLIELDD
jgi:DNA-binding NarL/FixJ family response regulator